MVWPGYVLKVAQGAVSTRGLACSVRLRPSQLGVLEDALGEKLRPLAQPRTRVSFAWLRFLSSKDVIGPSVKVPTPEASGSGFVEMYGGRICSVALPKRIVHPHTVQPE